MNGKGPFSDKTELVEAFLESIIEENEQGFAQHKEIIHELKTKILKSDKSQPAFICYGHNDLNCDNILVENGQISGIVDWEWSGTCNIDGEIFNCDFYRKTEYRDEFVKILDSKMDFDVPKAMADAWDTNILLLGTLVFGWHDMWGLKSTDPFVVQWVTELEILFRKYGFDVKLL